MWTQELPNEAGWYWFKIVHPSVPESAAVPIMMLVSRAADGPLWAEDLLNRERYWMEEIKGLWSGPLIPPRAGAAAGDAQTPPGL